MCRSAYRTHHDVSTCDMTGRNVSSARRPLLVDDAVVSEEATTTTGWRRRRRNNYNTRRRRRLCRLPATDTAYSRQRHRSHAHALLARLLAHPLCAKRRRGTIMLCCCFKNILLVISVIPNYLNICQTDLHEICRIGRTLPYTNDLKLFFSIPKAHCRGNQFCEKNRPPTCSSHDIR